MSISAMGSPSIRALGVPSDYDGYGTIMQELDTCAAVEMKTIPIFG